jgi:beta-glucosidase
MNTQGATSMEKGGFILGGIKRIDSEEELAKAVTLAKEVNQVVICAGLNVIFSES